LADLLINEPASVVRDGAGSAGAAIRLLIEHSPGLGSQFASEFVDLLLKSAAATHASDVHLVPDRDSLG
jgi:hypothetical protein